MRPLAGSLLMHAQMLSAGPTLCKPRSIKKLLPSASPFQTCMPQASLVSVQSLRAAHHCASLVHPRASEGREQNPLQRAGHLLLKYGQPPPLPATQCRR